MQRCWAIDTECVSIAKCLICRPFWRSSTPEAFTGRPRSSTCRSRSVSRRIKALGGRARCHPAGTHHAPGEADQYRSRARSDVAPAGLRIRELRLFAGRFRCSSSREKLPSPRSRRRRRVFCRSVSEEVHHAHPDIRFRIVDLSAEEGLECVARGEAEFGINFLGASRSDLKFTPLIDDNFVVACRADHPFASRKFVKWERPFRTVIDHQPAKWQPRPDRPSVGEVEPHGSTGRSKWFIFRRRSDWSKPASACRSFHGWRDRSRSIDRLRLFLCAIPSSIARLGSSSDEPASFRARQQRFERCLLRKRGCSMKPRCKRRIRQIREEEAPNVQNLNGRLRTSR